MSDLKSKHAIFIKGFLFLLTGLASAALIMVMHPDLKLAVLLALSVWAFCRFYYFCFYVIEKYVDNKYKYSGLYSFVRYCMKGKK